MENKKKIILQGDQLNMNVLFWYLVKRDFSSVGVAYTSVIFYNFFFSNFRRSTLLD